MKKLITVAIAAFTLGLSAAVVAPTVSSAAPGAHAAKAHGKRLSKLAAALNLTDAQKAQMKPIMQSTRQQVQAVKADTTLTPEEKKAKIKELRKGSREQLKAILTPDQQAKLKAMREHHKNKA